MAGSSVQVTRIDVDQPGHGVRELDGGYCGHESRGRGDHFVTRLDTRREQGQVKRRRAGVDRDRMGAAADSRKGRFEGDGMRAQGVAAAGDHLASAASTRSGSSEACCDLRSRNGITTPSASSLSSTGCPRMLIDRVAASRSSTTWSPRRPLVIGVARPLMQSMKCAVSRKQGLCRRAGAAPTCRRSGS